MHDQGVQVLRERGGEGRIGRPVVAGERLQGRLRLRRRAGLVEGGPVAAFDLAVQSLGQLREQVAERVHRAALAERSRPGLDDRLPEAGRPVGDHERRQRRPRRVRSRARSSQSS